jgi:winged helix DNA-binding protein
VRRYLAAFGPASRADIAKWSGLARVHVDEGLARLRSSRFLDERGRELYDLPRAPLPDGDVHAPARLLPRFDNLVLSHDDRSRVLPDEYRSAVIEGGEVRATFLVDGFVAGLWAFDGARVRLDPFAALPREARRELEDEARRLEAFLRAAGKTP